MNEKNKARVRLAYSILTSVLLLCLAVAFIVKCVEIYNMGSHPFTRQSISEAFVSIAPLVYATLIILAGGLVLFLFMPPEIGKIKSEASSARTLEILGKRINIGKISSDNLSKAVKRERSLRKLLLIIGAGLYAVGITFSLIHLLNINNYSSPTDPVFDPNAEVLTSAVVILLSLLIPIIYTVACIFVFENSRKREISSLKEALKEPRGEAEPCSDNLFTKVNSFLKKNEKTVILTLRISLISLSVLFIVLGAFNGSLSAVMQKAIKICKECIGMG